MSFSDHHIQNYSCSKKKTTIPSLLFFQNSYRNSLGFSGKKSTVSPRSMRSYRCLNHLNKIANFKGASQQLYYCQKCAILLASQGFSVQKIDYTSIQNEPRQKQVKEFLNKINCFSLEIAEKQTETKQNLISSQQFYGQQIEQINQYFSMIYQSLELEKNKCYNFILNQRTKVQQKARGIAKDLENLRQELIQIKEDIEDNIQAVYEIQQLSYRPVIIQYQDKFRAFSLKFQQIDIEPIQLQKLQFGQLPQSISSISQIMLRNSAQNLQQYAYNKENIPKMQNSIKFSFEGKENVKINKSDESIKQYFKMWQV